MQSIIEIKNLSKNFGQKAIIKDLTLQIKEQQAVCFFAPSGTGKTTLIKMINGLIQDFSGNITVNTNEVSTVFQEPNLFWYKTVRENILFPFKLKERDFKDDIKTIFDKWLKITGLTGNEDYYPAELSGGMQQKVALIRGFLLNPELILLDEPFKSIDIKSKNKIIEFILEHYQDTTILFVTHNIDEVPKLANRVILFKDDMVSEFIEINLSDFENESNVIKNIFEKIN